MMPSCPLCRAEQAQPFITGFDCIYPREGTVAYVRCDGCGLVYQSPMPDSATIATFYGEGYEPHEEVEPAREARREARLVNRFLIDHLYRANVPRTGLLRQVARVLAPFAMRQTLVPHGDCRLLDVGCGSGGWLYRHQRLGWQAEGAELSPTGVERARHLGLTIHAGTIFDVPTDRRYDLISFRHVLEHVPDPVLTLERARDLLAPGGRLLLLLPNLASHGFERYREYWYPLDPPRHLLQFTPATTRRIGEQVGLRLVDLETESQPRMLLQSAHYREHLGEDFGSLDLAARRERLADHWESEEAFLRRHKWRRKLLALPCRWWAMRGRGETLRAVFEKQG